MNQRSLPTHCRARLDRRRGATPPPWAARCHRPIRRPISPPGDADIPNGSLLDALPHHFDAERDSLDLLLHAAARLIEATGLPDDAIRLPKVLAQLAPGAWARHDSGPHTAAASGFLVTEAQWLIAYAAGTPGIDRDAGIISRVIGWIDACPRPLRAQILRAAANRYLG